MDPTNRQPKDLLAVGKYSAIAVSARTPRDAFFWNFL
jgi:hypothetical protein